MINSLIFSKDRACQLELLIRSIYENSQEINDIHVLYKATNERFEEGYQEVKNKYKSVTLHKETHFRNNFIELLDSFSGPYFLGFVDDDVLLRRIEFSEILKVFNSEPKIYCINLRMGEQLNYSYTQRKTFRIPQFRSKYPFLIWDWTEEDRRSEWGYPHAYEGHLVRLDEFREFVKTLKFDCPAPLESQMNHHRLFHRPWMIAFREPRMICIANNKVQATDNRNSELPEYDPTVLNDKFLDGYIIDLNNIYSINANAPHTEIPFFFVRE